MSAPRKVEHLIVGGGPAGLSEAFWRLRRDSSADLLVLEAAERCGGWVETRQVDGYTLEFGPQTFRPEPGLRAFLEATGLEAHARACDEKARRRWFDDGRKLHELPASPGGFLRSRLLGPVGKLRVMMERRVRSRAAAEESVADFVGRRFGAGTKRLAEAMMHGIYGGDAHQLEVASALPGALAMEAEHGSLLRALGERRKATRESSAPASKPPAACSFVGGMRRSVDVLEESVGSERVLRSARAARVQAHGHGYRVSLQDGRDFDAKTLSLATPAHVTARLVQDLDAELASELRGVQSVSVACTYLGYDAEALEEARFSGFGFLAPQGGPVLGAIDCTALFPDHAPDGKRLFRVMSGGFAHPRELERSDDELRAQGHATMQRALGVRVEPCFARTARARDAIAQPTRGHQRRLDRIAKRLAAHRGLEVRGASYRRVALPAQWCEEGSRP